MVDCIYIFYWLGSEYSWRRILVSRMDVATPRSCFWKVCMGTKRDYVYFSALDAALELFGNTARSTIYVFCVTIEKKHLDWNYPAWLLRLSESRILWVDSVPELSIW